MKQLLTESETFHRILVLGETAKGADGAVTACIVRQGRRGNHIIAEAVSKSGDGLHLVIHAEHNLLAAIQEKNLSIKPTDILYTTLEPCSGRWDISLGMRDCAGMIIDAGIKRVVVAELDPNQSILTQRRFKEAGVELIQTTNQTVRKRARRLFLSKVKTYQL